MAQLFFLLLARIRVVRMAMKPSLEEVRGLFGKLSALARLRAFC
jgi:hypothetical protein